MRERFRKSRKLSTAEKFKELYNIECSGEATQGWKIYGRRSITWTIVLTSSKSSGGSFPESYEMREMSEY